MIAMYGGAGTIGKNGILEIEAATNQAVCSILPSKHHSSEFLLKYLQFVRPYWMIGAEGTRRDPNIGQDDVRNMVVPFPSMKEQRAIAAYLDTKTQELDTQIADTEREIELLQEYRTALISEAVTGKIDVRQLEPHTATNPET